MERAPQALQQQQLHIKAILLPPCHCVSQQVVAVTNTKDGTAALRAGRPREHQELRSSCPVNRGKRAVEKGAAPPQCRPQAPYRHSL